MAGDLPAFGRGYATVRQNLTQAEAGFSGAQAPAEELAGVPRVRRQGPLAVGRKGFSSFLPPVGPWLIRLQPNTKSKERQEGSLLLLAGRVLYDRVEVSTKTMGPPSVTCTFSKACESPNLQHA